MSRWRNRIAVAVGGLVGFAAVVHVLESWRLAREREARARSDGALHRIATGEGPLVVLIPGFLGTSSYWGDAFDELARDHCVVSVDPLGFGRSPWPEIDYTLDQHLAALQRTIEQERTRGRVTLVGHSFGALLAAHHAARHPELVDRAVLLGLPIFHDEQDARTRIDRFGALASMFVLDRSVAGAACHVLCAFRPLFAAALPYLDRRHSPEAAADGVLHTWRSFDGTLRQVLLARFATEPILALGERAVLVHAQHDDITPLDRARALAARSGAQLVTVPGDHDGYLRQRRIILEAIRSGREHTASSEARSPP
jgi:pimeloyl-ACP methyl ester carboxylesterase